MRRAEIKVLTRSSAEARLAELRLRSHQSLAQLPSCLTENIPGTKALLCTYRDDLGGGRLRVVVQGVVPGWLGSAFVRAYGFTAEPDGSLKALSEEALWDFT